MISIQKELVAIGFVLISGCTTESPCNEFSSHFWISNWSDEVPVDIVLYSYDSGVKQEKYVNRPIEYMGSLVDNGSGKRFLFIKPKNEDIFSLGVNHEYKVVINHAVVYRISKIVSSNRPNLGCPLESAVVNTCAVEGGGPISFDQGC